MKKESKKKTLFTRLAQAVLVLLGMSSLASCVPLCMYGTPTQDFSAKGTVTDEAGTPIEGILVTVADGLHDRDTLYTDALGHWKSKDYSRTGPWGKFVIFTDVDGPQHGGRFKPAYSRVDAMESRQVKKSHDTWYEGVYEYTDDRKLTRLSSDTLDIQAIIDEVKGTEWNSEDDDLLMALTGTVTQDEVNRFEALCDAWKDVMEKGEPESAFANTAWEALVVFMRQCGSRSYYFTVNKYHYHSIYNDDPCYREMLVRLILPEHQALVRQLACPPDSATADGSAITETQAIILSKALLRIALISLAYE